MSHLRNLWIASAACVALLATANVHAQFGGGGNVDLTPYAKIVNVPVASSAIPAGASGAGVAGSGLTFVPANGAQRQTVQRTTVTTDASGNWTVTWATAFVSSTPTVNPIPLNPSSTTPYNCNVTTRSSTGATGKCWQLTSQTVALISLTISLAPTVAPTTTSVMLIAAEPTQ